MARVRSLSNHPYGGRMRIKGDEYDAADEDVKLLVSLRRVVPVYVKEEERTYSTRELQASVPVSGGARGKRRSAPAGEAGTGPSAPPPLDEQ